MYKHKNYREVLREIIEKVPEEKLGEAVVAIEDLLEFNEETQQAIREAEEGKNLLGPFYSIEEMNRALLGDDYEKYYDCDDCDDEKDNEIETVEIYSKNLEQVQA